MPHNWKTTKSKTYSGPLTKAVKLPAIKGKLFEYSGVNYVKRSREFVHIILPAWNLKLPLLFDHFGIKEDAEYKWERLAKALAQVHVPGFQVQRAEGARKKITGSLLRRLLNHVDSARSKEPRKSIAKIKGEPSFAKDFPEFKYVSVRGLENRISQARKILKNRDEQLLRRSRYFAQKG